MTTYDPLPNDKLVDRLLKMTPAEQESYLSQLKARHEKTQSQHAQNKSK